MNDYLGAVFDEVRWLRETRATHRTKGFTLADVNELTISQYLTGEAKELFEAIDYGKGRDEVLNEMGDVLGCLVNLCLRIGITEEELALACLNKLAARFTLPGPEEEQNVASRR